MNKQLPWDFIILAHLKSGKPIHVKEIYAEINAQGRDAFYIKPELYSVDGRWGDRPDYTNIVRSTVSNLKKRGMVEHLGRCRSGMYRITDAGLKRLGEIEP